MHYSMNQQEKVDPFCLGSFLLKTTEANQFDEFLAEHVRFIGVFDSLPPLLSPCISFYFCAVGTEVHIPPHTACVRTTVLVLMLRVALCCPLED